LKKQISFNDFVKRARKIHKDRYEYMRISFTSVSTKVDIVCKEHGIFSQLAYDHARGRGCPKCAKNQPMTFSEFKEAAKKVHGNTYRYFKKTFKVRGENRAIIECKKHGLFEQNIYTHTTGKKGCQQCYYESTRNTTQKFVTRALEVHDGRFSYNRTRYITHNKNIEVKCPDHGFFKVRPSTHLKSVNGGCIKCNKPNLKKYTMLYLVTVTKKDEPDKKYLKVGLTQNTIKKRFSNDTRYKYRRLDSFYVPTKEVRDIEQSILSECCKYRVDVPKKDRTAGFTEWLEFSVYKSRKVKKVFKKYKSTYSISNSEIGDK